MRSRAIRDLSQLSDSDFFVEAAEGLELVIANARRIYASAITLGETKHYHCAQVLQNLSEEEASKYLVLMDSVRCPRQPGKQFSIQLERFNNHLAKGLYAQAYWMKPASLGQLQEYLDPYREDLYLDGPSDVDWIFSNQISRRREEVLYVDYVAHEGGHTWFHPGIYDDDWMGSFTLTEPGALRIAGLLHDVGLSTSDALATVADLWRSEEMFPEMKWPKLRTLNEHTLDRLNSRSLLQKRSNSDYLLLIDRWQFPLYTLDLSPLEVDIESLRDKQRLWIPDWQ